MVVNGIVKEKEKKRKSGKKENSHFIKVGEFFFFVFSKLSTLNTLTQYSSKKINKMDKKLFEK